MATAIPQSPPDVSLRHPPGVGAAALARGTSICLGAALTADGALLAVLAVVTAPALPPLLLEIAVAIAVAVPGVLLVKVGVEGRHPLKVGVLAPEIVLASALVYLGVAMPVFHTAGVSYPVGLAQFLAVLAGLVLGAAGLVLAGANTPQASEAGRVAFPVAVRDGVIFIVGTIVVAIGIGQMAGVQLSPPKWNWTSFVTITVPGMLVLIAREMVKQALRRHPQRRPLVGLMLTEVMLVVGLFIMVFGSIANLTLGKNGYTTGFAGNNTGLVVLVAAAVFLVVVRGAAKMLARGRAGHLGVGGALTANLALAVGVIVFFGGERSMIVGKTPVPSFGAAFPVAAVIVLAGLLILIPGRVLAGTDAAALDAADHARSDGGH